MKERISDLQQRRDIRRQEIGEQTRRANLEDAKDELRKVSVEGALGDQVVTYKERAQDGTVLASLDPLLEHLPGLHEHGCSYREAGGFVRRLREDEGTWLGHVMEHVAIELQNVAGSPVTYGRTRSIDGQPGFTARQGDLL